MEFLVTASAIYSDNVSQFQKICALYKSMLDRNLGRRFCIEGNCGTIFMVEIDLGDGKWGATPKTFYSEEEANRESEVLKSKYPFISECRVIKRNIAEKNEKSNQLSLFDSFSSKSKRLSDKTCFIPSTHPLEE